MPERGSASNGHSLAAAGTYRIFVRTHLNPQCQQKCPCQQGLGVRHHRAVAASNQPSGKGWRRQMSARFYDGPGGPVLNTRLEASDWREEQRPWNELFRGAPGGFGRLLEGCAEFLCKGQSTARRPALSISTMNTKSRVPEELLSGLLVKSPKTSLARTVCSSN